MGIDAFAIAHLFANGVISRDEARDTLALHSSVVIKTGESATDQPITATGFSRGSETSPLGQKYPSPAGACSAALSSGLQSPSSMTVLETVDLEQRLRSLSTHDRSQVISFLTTLNQTP